jgi:hypothetical protein
LKTLSGFLKSLIFGSANSDGAERGSTAPVSANLLFIKNRGDKTCARSATMGQTGFYWRSFENQDALGVILSKKRFSLVLVDHREGKGDVLAYVNQVESDGGSS